MTTKKFIAKIKRKKGMLYFVDKAGIIWEKELNKGRSKKTLEKMRLAREKKLAERYF